jgi:putative endonuclease
MKTAYVKGIEGEAKAKAYMEARGYSCFVERFKCKEGEIDLIFLRERTLIFMEVKRRRTLSDAAFSISTKQQARLYNAALQFLASSPQFENYEMQFDVFLLDNFAHITHIEGVILGE